MAKGVKKRKEIKRKLLHKYRLVILNESTFEEKISLGLDISRALLEDEDQELIILPGEYKINYENSLFGIVRLNLMRL